MDEWRISSARSCRPSVSCVFVLSDLLLQLVMMNDSVLMEREALRRVKRPVRSIYNTWYGTAVNTDMPPSGCHFREQLDKTK
jgi:hypothetical protein